MKPKTLLILLIILLPLAVATFVVVGFDTTTSRHSHLGQHPFAGWQVDRITAIRVTHATGAVTLEKQGDTWTVADRYGYPADFSKISDLVRKISDSSVGSAFELFSDTLDRLQLHDPAVPDIPSAHKARRVVFQDGRGEPLLDILLGRAREGTMGGHYVLPVGSSVGYLVDRDFQPFGGRAVDWIQKDLLDVRPEAIRRVVCEDPRSGRTLYVLERPAPDRDPVWTGAVPGDDIHAARIDAVFRALINLSVEDVVGPADDPTVITLFDDPRPRLVYHLYDGAVYTIHPGPPLAGAGKGYALRVQVAYAPPADTNAQAAGALHPDADVAPAARAAALNARLAPWVYAVADWRHGSFLSDPGDLVAPQAQ